MHFLACDRTRHKDDAWDRAIKDFERANAISVERRGKDASAAKILQARTHVSLNEFTSAAALLAEVLAADPGNPVNYYHLGLIYADQHKFTEARRWYRMAVARRADYPAPYVKLAYIAREERDLAGMRAHLETYAHLTAERWTRDPDVEADVAAGLGDYWREVAMECEERDDEAGGRAAFERAKQSYRKALAARPGCVRALGRLIQLASETGEPQERIDGLKRDYKRRRDQEEKVGKAHRTTFC